MVLVIIDEVEDKRGIIFELDEKALLEGEIPPLEDIDDFNKGPVLLNRLILSQDEGSEL